MRRREINLGECTADMEILIKHLVWSFSTKFWQNEIFSYLLQTKKGLWVRAFQLAEYATDIEGHHESSDLSDSQELLKNPVLEKLIIDRIRYGSLRANTKITYYRHGNHHKTPILVFCQQLLTKRGFSDSLSKKFGPCRKGLKLSAYATDITVIMNQLIWGVSGNFWITPVLMARIRYAS